MFLNRQTNLKMSAAVFEDESRRGEELTHPDDLVGSKNRSRFVCKGLPRTGAKCLQRTFYSLFYARWRRGHEWHRRSRAATEPRLARRMPEQNLWQHNSCGFEKYFFFHLSFCFSIASNFLTERERWKDGKMEDERWKMKRWKMEDGR